MDGRIYLLKKLLAEKPDREWTIAEMAKTFDLSSPHFQKLFKANTGTSPALYLRELRLEKARLLLETTFEQIKQIGIKTGLGSRATSKTSMASPRRNIAGSTGIEFKRKTLSA